MSNNIFLGWPCRSNAATLTGGTWNGDLPRENMLTQARSLVARSDAVTLTSTRFIVDLQSAMLTRAAFCLLPNLSQAALIRVSWGTTSGGNDVATSGWVSAWAITIAYGGTEWPTTGSLGRDFLVGWALAAAVSARYIYFEVDDNANADGYLDFARLFVSDGIEPAVNAEYGMADDRADFSTVIRNQNGSPAMNAIERKARKVELQFADLTLEEGDWFDELGRRDGLTAEVLYLFDISDRARTQRYGFIGTLAIMPRLNFPRHLRRAVNVSLIEWT